MNLIENVRESFKSIKANRLRTVLTAMIIAIGITALVGILTAIEGIQVSVTNSFSSFGGNSFEISSKQNSREISQDGKKDKKYEPLDYFELTQFSDKFDNNSKLSVSTMVTGNAEVKYQSQTTNPNIRIRGVDENYLVMRGSNVVQGRNFTNIETRYGTNTAILGDNVYSQLFPRGGAIGKEITFLGGRYKVVGVLNKEGGFGGTSGMDRSIFIPVESARKIDSGGGLRFQMDVEVTDPAEVNGVMEEARGLMRVIRRDPIGEEDSFELEKNESVAESMEEISGYLRIGGFSIGFVTLLGASIGLMNIMLVSVTERTREIGIRKAVGASPKKIRQQFLIEAIVICQLGGLGGILFGIAIGNLVSSLLSAGEFVVPWFWIITGVVVCLLVGLISGSYPAFKASRLDPIDALRFE